MPVYYQDDRIRVHKIPCGDFGNNAYLVVCPQTRESVIIDTPAEPEKVLAEAEGTQVKAIFITHNHQDHLVGFQEIRSGTEARVGVHPADADRLPSPPDLELTDGGTFQVGRVELRFIHTPGHTPGSTCILAGTHLFTGDTLFPGGPGASRTPEALQQEIRSITQKLYVLPDEVEVYPGHGDNTILGTSQEEYRVFASREHPPDLCGDVLWLSS